MSRPTRAQISEDAQTLALRKSELRYRCLFETAQDGILILDGETGFVVDPRDVLAVRHSLDRLVRDFGLRTRMGSAARARAVTELSYDALAARLAPLAAGDLGTLREFG